VARGTGGSRRAYHHTVRLLFDLRVRDTDCDYRLFRRELVVDPPLVSTSGVISIEMMRRFRSAARHRRGTGLLVPASRPLAVLPAAGHRPLRPAAARALVAR
jgi:hypothetical protein